MQECTDTYTNKFLFDFCLRQNPTLAAKITPLLTGDILTTSVERLIAI